MNVVFKIFIVKSANSLAMFLSSTTLFESIQSFIKFKKDEKTPEKFRLSKSITFCPIKNSEIVVFIVVSNSSLYDTFAKKSAIRPAKINDTTVLKKLKKDLIRPRFIPVITLTIKISAKAMSIITANIFDFDLRIFSHQRTLFKNYAKCNTIISYFAV